MLLGLRAAFKRLPMQTHVHKIVEAMEIYGRRPLSLVAAFALAFPVHVAAILSATFAGKVPSKFVDVVGDIADAVGLAKGDAEEAVIERRIVPFVLDIIPGKQVKVNHDKKHLLKLGPGGRNGISSDIKKLPSPPKSMVVESTADVPNGTLGILDMKTVYAEPEGWAIISGRTASQSVPCGG